MDARDRPTRQTPRSHGGRPPQQRPRAVAPGPASGDQPTGVVQVSAELESRAAPGSRIRRSVRAATRVLLVVNDALYRCGLRAILESQLDVEVAGEAHDCSDAAERVRHLDPSVVLLDPRGLGISPVAVIRALNCRPLLVLASPGGEPIDETAALRAGASGLLLNTANPGELAASLRVVVAGYTLHLPATTNRIGGRDELDDTSLEEVPEELLSLTPRERQVFRLIASGFGNAEIARMLSLGESTIKSHVQHLLTKLDIPNRVHAVIYAYQHGLVTECRRSLVAGFGSDASAVA